MTDENKSYPRVLIVNSQSMHKNNATGITLRSLYTNWPSDRIMELYRWRPAEQANERLEIVSEQIPVGAMPLNYLCRKLTGKSSASEAASNNIFTISSAQGRSSIQGAVKDAIKVLLEFMPISGFHPEFLRKVDDFSPDVIYTIGGSVFIHRTALYFARRYNKKVVLHFMDNWRETAYMNNKYTEWLNRLLNSTVRGIEKKSAKGLAISEKMADEYRAKYGSDYIAMMNCIDSSAFGMNVTYEHKKAVVITYAGGLHLERYKQLLDIESAVADMNRASSGVTASLVIYTSQRDRDNYSGLFDEVCTVFKDYLPHEQVHCIYDEADILVHIESFDMNVVEYTKYSMSTKIPEYMASGKPILCYAPDNIAVFEYINSAQAGICVSRRDDLNAAVRTLAAEPQQRKRFGTNGIAVARANHTKSVSDSILHNVLSCSS